LDSLPYHYIRSNMPDSYDSSWVDFSTQVAPDMGGVFNNQDYSNFFGGLGDTLGYTGNMYNEAPMDLGYNESMGGNNWGTGQQLSPEFLQQLQGLSFNPLQGAEDPTVSVSRGQENLGNFRYGSQGGTMSKIMPGLVSGLVTGGFGAGLGGLFGSGLVGNAAGNALASGGMTAARGGDASQIGSSMLSSGLGSGIGATNPAGMMGLEGGLAKTVNAGIGGALGSAARGGNALQGGLSSMATTGLNNFSDLWDSFAGGGDSEFDSLQGSGGDMSGQTDVSANTYDEAAPEYRFGGEFSQTAQPGMKTAQSYSPDSGGIASFMPSGASVGNYLGSHGGDLAAMLYGFYNNKKQRQALQGQQQGLQDLYSQNSPYAQQLRNTLQAKAAAGGKRLNTGGREVQLQAMLADRAAQMAPTMYQIQQGQNNLQNNNMNMLLQGANKLGAFKAIGNGLQGMFGSSPIMQNASPYQNFMGDYNSLSGGQ
jgi:hypothetical protein